MPEDTTGLRRTTVWVEPATHAEAKQEAVRRGESLGAAFRRFERNYTRKTR
jgi:hypothetical protein